jgi:UDP-N-acetylmuramoyl-L-alanyl-D-glutamate--2,6-diaminopimelate ligase
VNVAQIIDWLAARGCAYPSTHLKMDSRSIAPGDVFVALPGLVAGKSADGRAFIDAAAARGAPAVLAEARDRPVATPAVPTLWIDDLRALLGELAAAFYGAPTERLLTVGVTGTNGKTSCSQWIAQMLTLAGRRCAVHGTIGAGLVDRPLEKTALTTPDVITLQRDARAFLDAGAAALAMEVSSIGLDQHRLDGVVFRVALFTNLTRDHLDYHHTMDAYGAAKTKLFDWPSLTHAVINLDDPFGMQLAHHLRARGNVTVIGCTAADSTTAGLDLRLRASAVGSSATGLRFDADDGSTTVALDVPLVGQFNVANLLGVLGVALACGLGFEQACALAPQLVPPPGRMQRVGDAGEPLAVIDYAHTPDALVQALAALRPLASARGGSLWVVFGAGGDRDPGKRAPMGAAAAEGADNIVITSDNPRGEDPVAIVGAVAAGVPGARDPAVRRIVDRAEAIAFALREAAANDVVLVAGKGHEDYQEIRGERRVFSDVEHARAALAEKRSKPC